MNNYTSEYGKGTGYVNGCGYGEEKFKHHTNDGVSGYCLGVDLFGHDDTIMHVTACGGGLDVIEGGNGTGHSY